MNDRMLIVSALLVIAGCSAPSRDAVVASGGDDAIGEAGDDPSPVDDDAAEDDSSGAAEGETGIRLDVGYEPTGGELPCSEGGCDDDCEVPTHQPCDANSDDLMHAIGLQCPGELDIQGGADGAPSALGVRTGFGPTAEWAPREGAKVAVLGTGIVAELDTETPQGDQAISPTHCNDDLGPQVDPGLSLPMPIRPVNVAGDCLDSPDLIGDGDCSNSIQQQWDQGISANDYSEIRIETAVPDGSKSLSYDLAFFSTEYPFYYFSEFNDMFVGWLESESWTGNISFDEQGNPISLNASFLDFRDDTGNLPELQGTCMRQHAGTKWLQTSAPVVPGEQITLVLAIFDLSDSILDSYVLLDNFQWGCEGGGGPVTMPVG